MAISSVIKNQQVSIGDTLAVHQEVQEEGKTRIQIFQGVIISIKGESENKSFTVRKISSASIGVERTWPVNSPTIKKVEVKKEGRVRRAKLYYLRKRTGKNALRVKARDKVKNIDKKGKRTEVKTAKGSKKKNSPKKTAGRKG